MFANELAADNREDMFLDQNEQYPDFSESFKPRETLIVHSLLNWGLHWELQTKYLVSFYHLPICQSY